MILNNKLLLNGILAFSILSLSIAYFIQYVLGHKPCNLCIIERIPYIAAIILISLIFILNKYQRYYYMENNNIKKIYNKLKRMKLKYKVEKKKLPLYKEELKSHFISNT